MPLTRTTDAGTITSHEYSVASNHAHCRICKYDEQSHAPVLVEEDPTHAVVVRGGHSLYCTECDHDVARLGAPIQADKRHEREVRALLRPGINILWNL